MRKIVFFFPHNFSNLLANSRSNPNRLSDVSQRLRAVKIYSISKSSLAPLSLTFENEIYCFSRLPKIDFDSYQIRDKSKKFIVWLTIDSSRGLTFWFFPPESSCLRIYFDVYGAKKTMSCKVFSSVFLVIAAREKYQPFEPLLWVTFGIQIHLFSLFCELWRVFHRCVRFDVCLIILATSSTITKKAFYYLINKIKLWQIFLPFLIQATQRKETKNFIVHFSHPWIVLPEIWQKPSFAWHASSFSSSRRMSSHAARSIDIVHHVENRCISNARYVEWTENGSLSRSRSAIEKAEKCFSYEWRSFWNSIMVNMK